MSEEQTIKHSYFDFFLFSDKRRLAKIKELFSKPIYMTEENEIVIQVNSDFRRVYRLFDDKYACFLSDPIFPKNSCRRVTSSQLTELPIETMIPLLFSLSNEEIGVKCDLRQNQYGTFLYFSGSEDAFESLLISITQQGLPKIEAWEDTDASIDLIAKGCEWKAKFSPALNKYSLASKLSKLFDTLPAVQTPQQQSSNSLSDVSTKHKEISKEEKILPNLAKERVTKPEKLLRQVLYHSLDNLAIHPDVNVLLKKNIKDCGALVNALKRINSDQEARFKRISGAAGSKGWSEFSEHIADGQSNRLRIYRRKAKLANYSYDIFVEYKQDRATQERTFKRLTKMEAFEGRRVIFE